jgi:signal transduction histidine kinase
MDKVRGLVTIRSGEDGDVWTFSVTDNGPGIPEQHYEKIFKIFQTLAAKDQVDTTGVGLTLVKKIVEMYGGHIWLTSEVGKGTTFYFTYPKQRTQSPVGAREVNQTA